LQVWEIKEVERNNNNISSHCHALKAVLPCQIISCGFSYLEPSSFPKAFPGPSTFFVGLSELVFAISSSTLEAASGPSSPSFLLAPLPPPIPTVSFTLSLVPVTVSLIFSPVEPLVVAHVQSTKYINMYQIRKLIKEYFSI
jgi:hypothetical protein